jgi:hypothetical protein
MANFFHTPKPRSYNYEPRFWNPEKEKREARERRIKAELNVTENGEYKPYIEKGEFKKGLTRGKWTASRQKRRSNTRLLILIGLLAVLVFFILK